MVKKLSPICEKQIKIIFYMITNCDLDHLKDQVQSKDLDLSNKDQLILSNPAPVAISIPLLSSEKLCENTKVESSSGGGIDESRVIITHRPFSGTDSHPRLQTLKCLSGGGRRSPNSISTT